MEQSLNSDFSLSYSLDRPLLESSLRFRGQTIKEVDQDEEVVNFDDEHSFQEDGTAEMPEQELPHLGA